MANVPRSTKSAFTGLPAKGRDNKSLMVANGPGIAPTPEYGYRREALQSLSPGTGAPIKPIAGLGAAPLPPGVAPTSQASSAGFGSWKTPGTTAPPPGNLPPALPSALAKPVAAPGVSLPDSKWENAAWSEMQQGVGMSDEEWQKQQAEALNTIDTQARMDQWRLNEQSGARGMGYSTQATQGFADIAVQAELNKAKAINDLTIKRQAAEIEQAKLILSTLAQFASAEDQAQLQALTLQLQKDEQALGKQELYWTEAMNLLPEDGTVDDFHAILTSLEDGVTPEQVVSFYNVTGGMMKDTWRDPAGYFKAIDLSGRTYYWDEGNQTWRQLGA